MSPDNSYNQICSPFCWRIICCPRSLGSSLEYPTTRMQKGNKFKSGICGPPSHAPLSFAPLEGLWYPIREEYRAQYQTAEMNYPKNFFTIIINRKPILIDHLLIDRKFSRFIERSLMVVEWAETVHLGRSYNKLLETYNRYLSIGDRSIEKNSSSQRDGSNGGRMSLNGSLCA